MNAAKNLSVVLYGKNDMRLEDRPVPSPGPNQLLIRVHTVGICGSDVHYWTHGSIGQFIVREPMVLGHETSGTVASVGKNVKNFSVGDRVALEPGVPCRTCEFCKKNRYNLCPQIKFFATPPVNGSLCCFLVHDADFCYRLPVNVSMEDGAFLEPLNVAVHSCKRALVSVGHTVLVIGAGPIGIANILTAKAMGASNILVTDIDDNRLKIAKEIGADITLNVSGMPLSDVAAAVKKGLNGQPDAVIECSGAASSIETGILSVKSGGVVVMVGIGNNRVELPMVEAGLREVDIRGVFRYANCYPTALEMVSSGKVDLSKITRAYYTLEQSKEAFRRFLKGDVVKVFIRCDDM